MVADIYKRKKDPKTGGSDDSESIGRRSGRRGRQGQNKARQMIIQRIVVHKQYEAKGQFVEPRVTGKLHSLVHGDHGTSVCSERRVSTIGAISDGSDVDKMGGEGGKGRRKVVR